MKHKPVQIWKLYEIKDNKIFRKNKYCKRCGDSFLAVHKDKEFIRYYCGKCNFTEMQKIQAYK